MTIDGTFGIGFRGLTEDQQLQQTARELEAVVVSQLLSAMRKTVPEGGLFAKSGSSELFRALLDAELARDIADRSPFGLAEAVSREFTENVKKPQENAESQDDHQDAAPAPGRIRRIA